MNQNTAEKEKSEMLEFTVSKKQLLGEPWKSINGEMLQNILFADGWVLARPVKQLHETENNKVKFYLALHKRDGVVNEITLKRSTPTGEIGADGKQVYKQEKLTVSVGDLPGILKYAMEKYKYRMEQENARKKQVEKKRVEPVMEVQKRVQEEISERFTVECTGNSIYGKIYAVRDNLKDEFLLTKEGEPHYLYNEQMAQIFAKDAKKVSEDGQIIKTFKDKEYALCKLAVEQNGGALYFIRNQTLELALTAVKQNPQAIALVNNEYIEKVEEQLPEIILNKLKRGEVEQKDVLNHLLLLNSAEGYSLWVVTDAGKRCEVNLKDIKYDAGNSIAGNSSYTVGNDMRHIRFSDGGIESVQYKGTKVASYQTAPVPREYVNIAPRRQTARVM